jgi:DNA polymerase I
VCVFVTADYGGLELATQAQMCVTLLQKSCLAQALNDGLDPHLIIAADLLGRPYAELKAVKAAGAGPDCNAGEGREACPCFYCAVDNARQTGKVANFGFAGGLGAKALVFFALSQYGVRLTEDQARALKRTWLRYWPEFQEYFRLIDWHCRQDPPRIQQLFSGRWRGGIHYTEACNTVFSGLGADIAKAAGWEICQGQYLPGYNDDLFGTRTNLFVHDDFVLECEEYRSHEAAMSLGNVMVKAAQPWLPDVRIGTEPMVTRRMSRKAKPVRREGRLVPWG